MIAQKSTVLHVKFTDAEDVTCALASYVSDNGPLVMLLPF
jgi:hypothetical protein